jgi:hypothetical protein
VEPQTGQGPDRAPATHAGRIVEIGDLPLFNEDLDPAPPPAWTQFRDELRVSDAVLFVTPECNRSIPGCLKNALDVGSRPPGQNAWGGLPAAVVSCTPYNMGDFGANLAIRQSHATPLRSGMARCATSSRRLKGCRGNDPLDLGVGDTKVSTGIDVDETGQRGHCHPPKSGSTSLLRQAPGSEIGSNSWDARWP